MNITSKLLQRINDRLTETKTPCKLYKSYENADKAGKKVAARSALHFTPCSAEVVANVEATHYLVVFIPSIRKYTVCFDLTELVSRRTTSGGYLGICGDFYTY